MFSLINFIIIHWLAAFKTNTFLQGAKPDGRLSPAYFSPVNFVKHAFYMDESVFFSKNTPANFQIFPKLTFSVFLQKTSVKVEKRTFLRTNILFDEFYSQFATFFPILKNTILKNPFQNKTRVAYVFEN